RHTERRGARHPCPGAERSRSGCERSPEAAVRESPGAAQDKRRTWTWPVLPLGDGNTRPSLSVVLWLDYTTRPRSSPFLSVKGPALMHWLTGPLAETSADRRPAGRLRRLASSHELWPAGVVHAPRSGLLASAGSPAIG